MNTKSKDQQLHRTKFYAKIPSEDILKIFNTLEVPNSITKEEPI